MDAERVWLEAAAAVEGELRAEVLDEAYEVYVAEAARTRVVDRDGAAHVRLRSGAAVDGVLVHDDPIAGHLSLRLPTGERAVVPVTGLVAMRGTRRRLRPESTGEDSRSLASWLRDCWSSGARLRVRTADAGTWSGILTDVGADHVGLRDAAGEDWVLPVSSVEAWIAPTVLG